MELIKAILYIIEYLISVALATVLPPVLSLLRSIGSLVPFIIVTTLSVLDYPFEFWKFMREEYRLKAFSNLLITLTVFPVVAAFSIAVEFGLFIPVTAIASVVYSIYLIPKGFIIGLINGLHAIRDVCEEDFSKNIAEKFIDKLKNFWRALISAIRENAADFRRENMLEDEHNNAPIIQPAPPQIVADPINIHLPNNLQINDELVQRINANNQGNRSIEEHLAELFQNLDLQLGLRTNDDEANVQNQDEAESNLELHALGQECKQYDQVRLTPEALDDAKKIMAQYAALEESNPIKNRKKELELAVTKYEEMDTKFQNIQAQIDNKELEEIEDELTLCNVTIPILLVKQYCENNEWKTVPSMNHVGDYKFLNQWIGKDGTHPLTRDEFEAPKKYNKPGENDKSYRTRYLWFKLTKDYCYVPELGELTEIIIDLTVELTQLLQPGNEVAVPVKVSTCRQTMFTKVEGATDDFTPEELAFLGMAN